MRTTMYLTAALLACLLSSCRTHPSAGRATKAATGRRPAISNQQANWTPAQKEWALGCAAVLTERNHNNHTSLAGCDLTEKTRAEMHVLLSDWWGIHSRSDLLASLAWLQEKGHRADFEVVGKIMAEFSQVEYERLLAIEDQPEVISKMEIARTYYPLLGPKSICGWDYSRAICLCRWAYVVGYISEAEAWQKIMPIARQLQQKFDSWEDLGQNFLIGRQFWSFEQTTKNGWQCEDAVQRLLDMRDSPWNRHPWDLDLSEKTDSPPSQPGHPSDAIVARG